MSKAAGPFEGLKVLELASVLAGPSVGQFFAELGAEVLKVENPGTGGDVTRSWALDGEVVTNGVSSYFASANWGKRSIFIDLTTYEGKALAMRHAQEADILISSYKPGDAEKLGLDFYSLKIKNPGLIYGHITGYGPTDGRAGYDAVVQAESGLMHINGEPGSPPLKLPVAFVDLLAAHQLKEGLLLALLRREKTGEGALVEISLFDAAVSSLANQGTNWLVAGKEPQAIGSAHPNIAPYGTVYRGKDGREVILAIGNDRQFQLLCQCLSIGELAMSADFSTNSQRVRNRDVLDAILSDSIVRWDRDELLARLNALKVPAGAVRKVSEAMEEAGSRGMLLEAGDLKGLRQVAFFVDGSRSIDLPPPPAT